MSNALQELRRKLEAQTTSKTSKSADNTLFMFWDAPDDTTTSIRFAPDKDESNPFFWRERQVINLTFNGVIGDNSYNGKEVKVVVPCMKMYGKFERCPVLEVTNSWWNTDREELARKYYKKVSYIMQGFVHATELKEENPPENPIRRFIINKGIFKNIEQGIRDPEMENMPTDYQNGTDFRIIKTKQGAYADYRTSTFARKETPLLREELEAIEKYDLSVLNDFLPNKPTPEGVDVIEQMFHASLEGQAYDPRWAEFFRPYDFDLEKYRASNAGASSKQTSESKQETSYQPEVTETKESKSVEQTTESSDDILAKLRSKIQNK